MNEQERFLGRIQLREQVTLVAGSNYDPPTRQFGTMPQLRTQDGSIASGAMAPIVIEIRKSV